MLLLTMAVKWPKAIRRRGERTSNAAKTNLHSLPPPPSVSAPFNNCNRFEDARCALRKVSLSVFNENKQTTNVAETETETRIDHIVNGKLRFRFDCVCVVRLRSAFDVELSRSHFLQSLANFSYK